MSDELKTSIEIKTELALHKVLKESLDLAGVKAGDTSEGFDEEYEEIKARFVSLVLGHIEFNQ